VVTAPPEIKAVELLNRLVQACRASETNFTIASQSVRRPDLKRLFDTYSKQRRRFATELEVEVARLGGVLEPRNGDSRVERRAMPRMVFAAIESDNTVVAKLANAENQTVGGYQEAATIELRSPIRAVIDRHTTAVLAGQNRIRELMPPSKKSA
jgi:uncharacterized protein (TIGR02284 family)